MRALCLGLWGDKTDAPKPSPSTATSRPKTQVLTYITSPASSRPEPCRHAAATSSLWSFCSCILTRPVLHLLTPLLASGGWDCPAQGTEDWGHPGTYLSTELVSCMVAVQGIQNKKQNWPVAPHGKRTWAQKGPRSLLALSPGPHPELSPTGSGWGVVCGRRETHHLRAQCFP